MLNPLSANPTKWSNTLKEFVGNLPTNCLSGLSVFDHFVGLAHKGLNIVETDTFTSTTSSESFRMNRKLNCDDNCLIYFLTFKCCGKQYLVETTNEFRPRWNNYKSNDRKNARNEACMQERLFEHFKSEIQSGFLGKVFMTFTDKTDRKDLRKRENYWIRTLKTYTPFGLNNEDSI